MLETYHQRYLNLLKLGFNNYAAYTKSELWAIARKVVYRRDNYRCRAPGCKATRKLSVHHVSYSLPVLLGIDPGALVTLCEGCHRSLEYVGRNKAAFEQVQVNSVRMLGRNGKRRIGRKQVEGWLLRQRAKNRHVARRALLILENDHPNWYDWILSSLLDETLPKSFKRYLDLEL